MIFCWNFEVYPKSNLGRVLEQCDFLVRSALAETAKIRPPWRQAGLDLEAIEGKYFE